MTSAWRPRRQRDRAPRGRRFRDAFLGVWEGRIESDGLNALVLSAGLDADQVRVLRTYARYLRQAGIPFTQAYLERVMTAIRRSLAPSSVVHGAVRSRRRDEPESRAAPLRRGIAAALDEVVSADDDRILRRFLNLVEATLRTNYFQTDATDSRSLTSRSSWTAAGRRPAAAAADGRDLRLQPAGRGHPPARRQGGARRHPLVRPAGGLPHRGPRA